ncbi:hypothetical protein PWY87_32660 [Kribbella solani]|uniref:hypothetical protein n=1 Tax=Kribbella solani TaxID=236067 RepID=UPI0029BE2D3B|nr:hypothetical protein [Kribbella solani]MDX3006474.1 hypothetical protein [Kribbella solani]
MTTWTKVTGDFDFFSGHFDVRHRRLKHPLTDSSEWEEFDGTTTAHTYFDGQISIDETHFPQQGTYGLSLRLFDPVAKQWSIWWVSSTSMKLYPPVHGSWSADGTTCTLIGDDEHDGRPVLCRFVWSDITETTAHWEQAYSGDGGASWETNWTMDFTRRDTPPPALDVPKVTDEFDFLVGNWSFHNRRRRPVLGEPHEWYEHDATLQATTYFDGAVSFDEGWFPSEGFRGATFRLYDPVSREWSIYWINSKNGRLEPPVVGKWNADGTGVFEGPDTWDGQPIDVRFHWTAGTDKAAWEQAFSTDQGKTWTTNWFMEHTRI